MDHHVIDGLVQCCGVSSVLYVGDEAEGVLQALRSRAMDARSAVLTTAGLSEAPVLTAISDIAAPPGTSMVAGEAWQPDTVFCSGQTERIPAEHGTKVLKWFSEIARRNVVLHVWASDAEGRGRAWWEKVSFEAGLRVHPRSYQAWPYAAREGETGAILIFLEKIPESALAAYPLDVLEKNRILHMDMLRETGRRGDAHCIRYHMASRYIRPGDAVLDVACGLGYGSHILYQNSRAKSVLGVDLSADGIAYAEANYGLQDAVRFRVGDAQTLDFLLDNSVDFITGFETIEHVPDPLAYLKELKRVLRPSGRLMVCAPNDWTDDTGQDPNPHHLHVYTWERLFDECSGLFLLEKGFAQTAGGGMKLHHAPRKWEEVPLERSPDRESEWAVLLCMADPLEGMGVPYTETAWAIPDSPEFNVSAFARDYENPWLVRGMVAMGMRNLSPDALRSIQGRVLLTAPQDSVDYGAALCGRAYDLLASETLSLEAYDSLMESVGEYAAIMSPSPHQLRWQVSLLFAGGELARRRGDMARAMTLYAACADIDVQPYSPLLGNRTLDALFWLAVIALRSRDAAAARRHLVRSIEETRRLLSGSWTNICGGTEDPLPFGLAEAAQLLDRASRAAYMLAVLDDYDRRPGVFAAESKGYFERLLLWKDRDATALRTNIDVLVREVCRLDSVVKELADEVARLDTACRKLGSEAETISCKRILRTIRKRVFGKATP